MIIDSPIISGSLASTGSLNQIGNVVITGSLTVTGPIVGSITGSADSASFATTASYAVSASHAERVDDATSASYAVSASHAERVDDAISSSYAVTSSYSLSGSYSFGATSASYAASSTSASYALNSTTAVSSSYPIAVSGSTLYTTNPFTAPGDTNNSINFGNNAGALANNAGNGVFLGYEAGYAVKNTTDANFLGYRTGIESTGSYNSNFLGNRAGSYTLNANDSNFLGYRAGNSTQASNANFLGYFAGSNATYALGSNFLGYQAGGSATSASLSNFLGSLAGYTATNASASNFLGSDAGYAARFASNSNFLGYRAGYQAASASYSTFLGFQAGYNTAGGALGVKSNNIIIGTNITLTDGVSNAINIGGLIFGTGSYANIVTDTFSGSANGKIGINQPTPLYNLDVSGSGNFTNGLTVTGSLLATSITSSLLGTASYASQALSSSYAANADLLDGRDSLTYANTGSNTFTDTQYINAANNAVSFTSTASLYTDGGVRVTKDMYVSGTAYFNNVTVFGTQSISYISSSQLNIGTNIISVNTDTPTIRFGGLSVYDSGSTGLTGSILWDSENNHWVYSNPSGSSYSGGMFISGPRSSALGSEQGTTNNALMKGQGGDHITSSAVFEVSGSVGIGTTTPGEKLQVNGNVLVTGGQVYGATSYGNAAINATYGFSSSDLVLTAGNSEKMRISGSGNVGIGTTTPGVKLTVLTTNSSQDTYVPALKLHNNDNSANTGYGTGIEFQMSTDYQDYKKAEIRAIATSGYANGISLAFWAGGSSTSTHLEVMRLTPEGNVGIGTTTPNYKLRVEGDFYTSGSSTLAGTSNVIIKNYSNYPWFEGQSASAQIFFGRSGTNPWAIGADATYALKLWDSNFSSSYFNVLTNGNVGIGTTTPGYKLDVNGSLNVAANVYNYIGGNKAFAGNGSSFLYLYTGTTALSILNNADSGELVRITNGGNVGIGTTSPNSKLHTTGNITIENSTNAPYIQFVESGDNTDAKARIEMDQISGTDGQLLFYTEGSGTLTNRMGITNTGAYEYRASDGVINMTAIDTSGGTANDYGSFVFNLKRLADGDSWPNTLVLKLGNVGIGTAAPAGKFEIKSAAQNYTTAPAITFTDNTGVSDSRWILGNIATTYGAFNLAEAANASSTSYTPRITILPGGDVGIGTTSPSYKLAVSGIAAATSLFTSTQGLNVSNYGFLSQTLSGQMTILGHNVRASNSVNNQTDVVNGGWISSMIKQYYNDGITFHTSPTMYSAGAVYPIAATERMRIDSNGNVGIGTTTVTDKLEVRGADNGITISSIAANRPILQFVNGSTMMLKLSANGTYGAIADTTGDLMFFKGGSVGIGTTNPVKKLHINGTLGVNNGQFFLGNESGTGNEAFEFYKSTNTLRIYRAGNAFGGTYTADDVNLDLYSGTAYSTRIAGLGTSYFNAGNIGIGTTSADRRLCIEGSGEAWIRATTTATSTQNWLFGQDGARKGFEVYDASATSTRFFVAPSSGNVGIGTTAPGQKLQVYGDLLLGSSQGVVYKSGYVADSNIQNVWYNVHTFNIYELTAFILLVGYEQNSGDGNNLSAVFVDSGTNSYGTGFSTTRLTGSTGLEAQRSSDTLQIRVTVSSAASGSPVLRWTLIKLDGQ